MGQSKLVEGRDLDAPFEIFLVNDDGSRESFGFLTFPFQRYKKGLDRLEQIQGRAGSIVALLLNPHERDVLSDVRKLYSPEAQEDYIPVIQGVGRRLLRLDWCAIVPTEEVGLGSYEDLIFYSSAETARKMGLDRGLAEIDTSKLVEMAARPGQTIA